VPIIIAMAFMDVTAPLHTGSTYTAHKVIVTSAACWTRAQLALQYQDEPSPSRV
jgi:hypothetical protein